MFGTGVRMRKKIYGSHLYVILHINKINENFSYFYIYIKHTLKRKILIIYIKKYVYLHTQSKIFLKNLMHKIYLHVIIINMY